MIFVFAAPYFIPEEEDKNDGGFDKVINNWINDQIKLGADYQHSNLWHPKYNTDYLPNPYIPGMQLTSD